MSALASRSELSLPGGTLMPATASGDHFAASAFSISATRNTLDAAPVTATRTPLAVSAAITPTMA